MKKSFFRPFIGQLLETTLLYLGMPAILLATGLLEISINHRYKSIGVLFVMIVISLYAHYVAAYFIPGISSLIDMATHNYVTEKMTYVNSFVTNKKFSPRTHGKDKKDNRRKMSEAFYLTVILATNRGKCTYSTTFFHTMEEGKSYTVTYGKHSKILLSVLSKDGEELLQVDP